jgi:proline iminopeptidase
MDPGHMEWMSTQIPNARYAYMPNGSHLSQYDDEDKYFNSLISFISDVNTPMN